MATNAPITKELFGKTSNGEEVYKFTFSNENKVTITVLNYGCIIYEIKTPDKKGEVVDVNLGFDNLKDYETNNNYFGALCGRVANRIGNAQFTLDNKTYTCSKNDPFGGHCVHGGHVGFARRVWSWSIKDNQLILSYTDPDGSEGMPGEVVTHVTYSLDSDNVFTMDYQATTNKATPIDLGSHFMVNLGGHNAGPIRDHIITINSNRFLEMGKDFLPTGEVIHVGGTCMDFRHPRLLPGKVLELMTGDMAFHHGYCVGDRTERGQKKLMGKVEHNHSGRYMEVYSTNVLVFVYSNHYMETILKKMPCKDGAVYDQYGAIEMMPMGYPNAINMPRFPTSVVRPGETYHETAWYKFGVEK